jgi:hypothetical protein
MPQLSEAELSIIRTLAEPLEPRQRQKFVELVQAELATQTDIGPGIIFRISRACQKQVWDPPNLSTSPKFGRRYSASSS